MEYYLIPLYDAKVEDFSKPARLEFVDKVLVEKDFLYVNRGCIEKMTESYFTCYSDYCFNEDGLREEFSSFFQV